MTQLTPAQECEHFLLLKIRYHEDRETFFGRLTRLSNLFTLISGLATVVSLAGRLPLSVRVDPVFIGAATSIVGALQLVFGFSRSENQHAELRRQFIRLLAELPDGDFKAIRKKADAVLVGEAPVYRAVNALAYNNAQSRFDGDPADNLRVLPLQWIFRNWRRFSGTKFPRMRKVWEARETRLASRTQRGWFLRR